MYGPRPFRETTEIDAYIDEEVGFYLCLERGKSKYEKPSGEAKYFWIEHIQPKWASENETENFISNENLKIRLTIESWLSPDRGEMEIRLQLNALNEDKWFFFRGHTNLWNLFMQRRRALLSWRSRLKVIKSSLLIL